MKWYIPERDHEQARALRDAYLDGPVDLVAPALMPFEAITALTDSGHYEGERLEDAAQSLPKYGLELVPFDKIGPIGEIATDFDSSLYEPASVGLARTLDTTAYTADETVLDDLDGDGSAVVEHVRTYSS